MTGKGGNPGLKGKLIEKSIEAYILSLEIINKLSVKYRVETFVYLICNAWELLLKAKIIDENKSCKTIYYKKKRNQTRRSLSLKDCLRKIFDNEKDPIRRNIERIEEFRDDSVHLIISQIPKDILGLFQVCVINYQKHLLKWFDISLSDRVPVGMMSIVYDFNPQEFDFEDITMKKKLGRDAFKYLSKFQADLKKELDELGKSSDFSIDIGYTLGLIKQPKEGDIILTQGSAGNRGANLTGIIEVPKDPSRTHPYRRDDLLKIINDQINEYDELNRYDMNCVNNVYQIKKNPDYFYQGKVKGSPAQYSDKFKEWLIDKYQKDSSFFLKARQKYKKLRDNRKHK
jgi:hypothetical protein